MKKISSILFFFISVSLLIRYGTSIEKEKTEAIKEMILESNFSILRETTVQLDEDSAAHFYAEHTERSFFNNLIKYMTSGPVFVMVLEKEDAIVDWRALIGSEDASKAMVSHPNSIRAMCGLDLGRTCVHGSDSPQSAAKEISFFFGEVSTSTDGDHELYQSEGLLESPSVVDDGDRFSPIVVNATSVNVEVTHNKVLSYILMVNFMSFLQVNLFIRQMEHSKTQPGAARNSIFMIGQLAIVDAYLCPLHLRAGTLMESLSSALAMASLSKIVVFYTFATRYDLAMLKANTPASREGWETMRRELSVLYSRFYWIVLGGVLIIYQFHGYLRPILLLTYAFWIPQIVTNVIRNSRKPLHPLYILGITATRLVVPLYVFGCPNNIMRIYHDQTWCIFVVLFMGLQATMLLLQHYLGSRWCIPHQMLPKQYNYYDRNTCQATDCAICLATIDLPQRSNDCMATPCDHFFHSNCLQRWMDIKMECPTCRRPLPAG
ncbi:hypothetical protein MKX03_020910 [Papaver bracteatum]|nr:hypothetical protein MKX03_020910 [Papaver bracteatum]